MTIKRRGIYILLQLLKTLGLRAVSQLYYIILLADGRVDRTDPLHQFVFLLLMVPMLETGKWFPRGGD